MSLARFLPDEDYRFTMRFDRGRPEEFFAPTAQGEALMAERRRWLRQAPEHHAGLLPEGGPLLEEAILMFRSWASTSEAMRSASGVCSSSVDPVAGDRNPPASPPGASEAVAPRSGTLQACLHLGQRLEPDWLLMTPEAAGSFRLVAGCVCFPSSWSLAEKMGRPLEEIHSVVPGLNAQVARPAAGFLSKMAPDIAWLRANWGLSRSAEMNQHPERGLPRLDATIGLNDVWLRVERQALVSLPATRGVLFGIRVEVYPLAMILVDEPARRGLRRALNTMPEAMAAYKGLAAAREKLLKLLD